MAAATTVLLLASFCAVPCELWEFTSPHCAACVEMQPVIRELQAAGLPIRQVDVSRDPETARAVGVQSIPAYVVVADGQIVARDVGRKSPQQLAELFRRAQSLVQAPSAGSDRPNHLTAGQAPAEPSVAAATANPTGPGVTAAPLDLPSEIDEANLRKALNSTVRLRVEDDEGISYGTGTIIDAHDDEVLVLTCAHIFSSAKGHGKIYCDLFVPGATPGIEGKLISENIRRDVGLVSLRPHIKVEPVNIGSSSRRAAASDAVYSIGCDHGQNASVIANRVLAVNRYHGPANLVVGGRPVDGRSGGGLFASDGTLIGVCNAADQEQDEGLYAALGPIHAELDAAGLAYIYAQSQPAIASRPGSEQQVAPAAPSSQLNSPTYLPGQNSGDGELQQPLPAESRRDPGSNRPPGNIHPAAPSLAARANTEVICIVRTAGGGQGSQVYVLDRPSPTLVQQLSAELNRRGPHAPTSLRDPRLSQSVSQLLPSQLSPSQLSPAQLSPSQQPAGRDWCSAMPTP